MITSQYPKTAKNTDILESDLNSLPRKKKES